MESMNSPNGASNFNQKRLSKKQKYKNRIKSLEEQIKDHEEELKKWYKQQVDNADKIMKKF